MPEAPSIDFPVRNSLEDRMNPSSVTTDQYSPKSHRPTPPDIRKYHHKFGGEVLCGSLWGVNLLVGTDNALLLLDRSGNGKVFPLISRRRFFQIEALEGLNVMLSISGKKNKLRAYYLSWLRGKILRSDDSERTSRMGFAAVGEIENCVSFKVVQGTDRLKYLVIATKSSIELYAWAQKPYSKFMQYRTFGNITYRPIIVDFVNFSSSKFITYASSSGFHNINMENGDVSDLWMPYQGSKSIKPFAIIPLPTSTNLLLCYDSEGAYVDIFGRQIKARCLRWDEMPQCVSCIGDNLIMGWCQKAIEVRSLIDGTPQGTFVHKRALKLKYLCERNDKVFFSSIKTATTTSSRIYVMALSNVIHNFIP